MPYMSGVIKKIKVQKKNNDSFIYWPKSLYQMKFSGMDRNKWNGVE